MRIHGYKGQVMADPTGGATPVAVASVNEWTLDMSKDTVDVTAFQDENKVYVLGLKDVQGTIGAWYDNSDLTLFEIADADIPALLKLIPDTRQPTFFWTGLAYLDASINVSSSGAVSVSGKFVAAGPWTREPVGVARRTPGGGELVGEALPKAA
jgi:hypothetical protein